MSLIFALLFFVWIRHKTDVTGALGWIVFGTFLLLADLIIFASFVLQ